MTIPDEIKQNEIQISPQYVLQLTKLKAEKSEINKHLGVINNNIEQIEYTIKSELNKKIKFLNKKFNINIFCYFDNYESNSFHINISHIANENHKSIWYWNSKHGWFVNEGIVYTTYTIKKIPLPITEDDLKHIIEELSIFDIEVRISDNKIKEIPTSDNIKSFADIQLFLGENTKLLLQKELWSVGWDIPDHMCIVEVEGKIHIFYDDSGHGFEWKHLSPTDFNKQRELSEHNRELTQEEYDMFNLLKYENKEKLKTLDCVLNVAEDVLDKNEWKEKILKSWNT